MKREHITRFLTHMDSVKRPKKIPDKLPNILLDIPHHKHLALIQSEFYRMPFNKVIPVCIEEAWEYLLDQASINGWKLSELFTGNALSTAYERLYTERLWYYTGGFWRQQKFLFEKDATCNGFPRYGHEIKLSGRKNHIPGNKEYVIPSKMKHKQGFFLACNYDENLKLTARWGWANDVIDWRASESKNSHAAYMPVDIQRRQFFTIYQTK